MAEITFKSAGVKTREIDLSQPSRTGPVGVPAGIIGTSLEGPAFVPLTFANYSDFTTTFGKSDGSKFGKSEDGNVWLDPDKTSPYKFFQYWLNISDEDAEKCIKFFSILNRETILGIEKDHKENPHLRILQNELAKEMTIRVHGKDSYLKVLEGSKILFGKNTKKELERLSEKDFLMFFEGVPTFNISKELLNNKIEVKRAVEKKFNVKVKKVGIINQSGKEKTMNVRSGGRTIRTTGRRSSFKKAIVTLFEGFKIDFIGSDNQGN